MLKMPVCALKAASIPGSRLKGRTVFLVFDISLQIIAATAIRTG